MAWCTLLTPAFGRLGQNRNSNDGRITSNELAPLVRQYNRHKIDVRIICERHVGLVVLQLVHK
jgi:hypothetical protein